MCSALSQQRVRKSQKSSNTTMVPVGPAALLSVCVCCVLVFGLLAFLCQMYFVTAPSLFRLPRGCVESWLGSPQLQVQLSFLHHHLSSLCPVGDVCSAPLSLLPWWPQALASLPPTTPLMLLQTHTSGTTRRSTSAAVRTTRARRGPTGVSGAQRPSSCPLLVLTPLYPLASIYMHHF